MHTTVLEVIGKEPVTLEEAKEHLRIEYEDDDNYINSLITIAREYCESFTRRVFISSTLCFTLSAFPPRGRPVELFLPPLEVVDWVKYKDDNGELQTLTEGEDYLVINSVMPNVIVPVPGKAWPAGLYAVPDAVQIQYRANPGDVPRSVKQAMLLIIGHYYENREMTSDRRMQAIPMGVDALLYPYRVVRF